MREILLRRTALGNPISGSEGCLERQKPLTPKSARAKIPQPMKIDSQLPSFEGATEWLNRATPNALETVVRETKGRPTIVHFWSINSQTSKTDFAKVAELQNRGKRDGLRVIAVHTPRSEEEKDAQAVRAAIARLEQP